MFARTLCALVLSLFCANLAEALGGPTIGGPSTGLWARAGDGGRGFNIDIQGHLMTVTTFVYTSTGQPIWYLSSGIYNHDTGRFQSSYDSYSDGQCFGCPPNQPLVHSGAAGNMTIQFHNNVEATISTPSGSIEIKKFNYAFGSATEVLYGEWVASFSIAGLPGGDWMVFSEPFQADDGTIYAAGTLDGISNGVALGRFVPEMDAVLIITTRTNSSFNHWYKVGIDDRRGLGGGWVLRTDETPSGNGTPTFMARLLWKPELSRTLSQPAEEVNIDSFEAVLASKSICGELCEPLAESARMLAAVEQFKREKMRVSQ